MMGWMAPLRHLSAKLLSDRISSEWEPSMSEITTIGLDLAKHLFQVHGIDAQGTTVLRKRLRRGQVLAFFSRIPRCVVGLGAVATAAGLGHGVVAAVLGRCPEDIRRVRRPFEAARACPRPRDSPSAQRTSTASKLSDSPNEQERRHRRGRAWTWGQLS